jgi:hypothetical protein
MVARIMLIAVCSLFLIIRFNNHDYMSYDHRKPDKMIFDAAWHGKKIPYADAVDHEMEEWPQLLFI